jgi:hypothetical protein
VRLAVSSIACKSAHEVCSHWLPIPLQLRASRLKLRRIGVAARLPLMAAIGGSAAGRRREANVFAQALPAAIRGRPRCHRCRARARTPRRRTCELAEQRARCGRAAFVKTQRPPRSP